GFTFDWLKLPIFDANGTPVHQRCHSLSRRLFPRTALDAHVRVRPSSLRRPRRCLCRRPHRSPGTVGVSVRRTTAVRAKGPSQTAVRTAMRRAAHYLLDAEPKILSDTFARAFAGFSSDQEFLAALGAVPSANLAWLRTSFALRSRLAEDELADAVKGGVAQYV